MSSCLLSILFTTLSLYISHVLSSCTNDYIRNPTAAKMTDIGWYHDMLSSFKIRQTNSGIDPIYKLSLKSQVTTPKSKFTRFSALNRPQMNISFKSIDFIT
eukprot:180747_1